MGKVHAKQSGATDSQTTSKERKVQKRDGERHSRLLQPPYPCGQHGAGGPSCRPLCPHGKAREAHHVVARAHLGGCRRGVCEGFSPFLPSSPSQEGGERLYQPWDCCSERSPEASRQTVIAVDGRKHYTRWQEQLPRCEQRSGAQVWALLCPSRGVTRCPLGTHLPPVRRNKAQEPQAHHQFLLHVTPSLRLADEVQSGRAIRVISSSWRPTERSAWHRLCPSIHPGALTGCVSAPQSRGASTAASRGGKAAPVTCHHQRWLWVEGWSQHFTLPSCSLGTTAGRPGSAPLRRPANASPVLSCPGTAAPPLTAACSGRTPWSGS